MVFSYVQGVIRFQYNVEYFHDFAVVSGIAANLEKPEVFSGMVLDS